MARGLFWANKACQKIDKGYSHNSCTVVPQVIWPEDPNAIPHFNLNPKPSIDPKILNLNPSPNSCHATNFFQKIECAEAMWTLKLSLYYKCDSLQHTVS